MNLMPAEILSSILSDISLQDLYRFSSTCEHSAKQALPQLKNLKELFIFAKNSFAKLQQSYREVGKYYHLQKIHSLAKYGGCLVDQKSFNLQVITPDQSVSYHFLLSLKLGKPIERPIEPPPTFWHRLMPGIYNMYYEYIVPIEKYNLEFPNAKITKERQVLEFAAHILNRHN